LWQTDYVNILAAGKPSVRQTLTTPKGGRRLGPPKRSKSRRSVKLTIGAVEALRAHRERQLEEREKLAELWQDHDFVFTTQVGTPLNRHNFFRRCYKPLLEEAGLPRVPSAFTISLISAQRSCFRRT
jgi:integrase